MSSTTRMLFFHPRFLLSPVSARSSLISNITSISRLVTRDSSLVTVIPTIHFSTSSTSSSTSSPDSKRVKVYTKTGDKGTSSLFNMQRMPKNDPHFQALGEVDELNAQCGVCRAFLLKEKVVVESLVRQIEEIQSRLFDVGAHLATPLLSSSPNQLERTRFDEEHVTILEKWIDEMDDQIPPLKNFILPGGCVAGSSYHVARAVCRRAERKIIPLVSIGDADSVVQRYMNRLSDYLFVAARFINWKNQEKEVLWSKRRIKDEK